MVRKWLPGFFKRPISRPDRLQRVIKHGRALWQGVPCLALPLPSSRGEGRLVAFKRQKPPKWDQKGTKRGLGGAQAYRENSQKRDFSKSDSEQFLFRKFYMGRGGSKEPPGGIISPMALYARAQLIWNAGNFCGKLPLRPPGFLRLSGWAMVP